MKPNKLLPRKSMKSIDLIERFRPKPVTLTVMDEIHYYSNNIISLNSTNIDFENIILLIKQNKLKNTFINNNNNNANNNNVNLNDPIPINKVENRTSTSTSTSTSSTSTSTTIPGTYPTQSIKTTSSASQANAQSQSQPQSQPQPQSQSQPQGQQQERQGQQGHSWTPIITNSMINWNKKYNELPISERASYNSDNELIENNEIRLKRINNFNNNSNNNNTNEREYKFSIDNIEMFIPNNLSEEYFIVL